MSRWITENPFYVLELRPEAGAAEVEAQGERWLRAHERGLSEALSYATPLGLQARDAGKVRRAMAELADAELRPVHELWARLRPVQELDRGHSQPDPSAPWPEALRWFRR